MARRWALLLMAMAVPAYAGSADALQARYAAMKAELAESGFGRPLHIESREEGSKQTGDIYAAIDMPFPKVASALRDPGRWCDILVLPANVTRCSAADGSLALYVVRKPQDPPEDAYRVDLRYQVLVDAKDYREVLLSAPSGPMGTRNYRIHLEAAALDAQRSFMHLSYSYALGLAARIAMQGYFATSGRDKVGFSIVGRQPDGRPVYVDGARGAVERNAMRYYLAVEAFLESLGTPPPERLETRLRDWYASIEQYPQLKEDVNREEYLRLKRLSLLQ